MQMIQGTLRDVLKKVAGERPGDPTKLCDWAKNCRPHKFFQNFLDVGMFWHSLKDFKVGVALLLVPLLGAWAVRSSGRGPREIKNFQNLQVEQCLRASSA